ncbi:MULTISPECIES: hypothetical protein [Bradyrhizobium]|uniref:Uncharacterized protein n=1 Tax=Bradyrhizobium arachidis TaxID=858423 RepID=A0AAE7NPY5_9BRAD|nr:MULTISPECIES: hypothetical protein [Bradyrhizobium]QOZ66514.1 hypothetical protein WN72_09080 [Bradyrhizobium arachidis]SFV19117.1 hypothetical protein SAMN05192541_14551 [Bradyrhizobium arachidis]
MYTEVVPALKKRAGSEDLSISLTQFWTLPDISARAVLSESYRNAFGISVYWRPPRSMVGAPSF